MAPCARPVLPAGVPSQRTAEVPCNKALFVRVHVEPAACAPASAAALGALAEAALRELFGSEGAGTACQLKALRRDVLKVTPAEGVPAARKRAADAHAAALAALAAYSGGKRGLRVICERVAPFAAALAAPGEVWA